MRIVKYSYRNSGMHFSYKISDATPDIHPHTHQFWELIFLKHGNMTYRVCGKEYRPAKNSMIIIRPNETHSIIFHDQTVYERYLIHFKETDLYTDVWDKIPVGLDVISLENNELIFGLLTKLGYYTKRFDKESMKVLLIHIVEEILYNSIAISRDSDKDNDFLENPILLRAVRYINENISENISVDDLAVYLSVNKSHLHHLFARYMSTTPKKFIVSQKLQMAREELRDGAKATEVYSKYGFSDYSSFYRNYVRYFNRKPSDTE